MKEVTQGTGLVENRGIPFIVCFFCTDGAVVEGTDLKRLLSRAYSWHEKKGKTSGVGGNEDVMLRENQGENEDGKTQVENK